MYTLTVSVCYECNTLTYQHNETNVMHFLFNLLRLNALKCFEHYLLILRRRYTNGNWYIACYFSWLHQHWSGTLTLVQPIDIRK
jgi:hypothetical protein